VNRTIVGRDAKLMMELMLVRLWMIEKTHEDEALVLERAAKLDRFNDVQRA